ncbi:hypothetical protein PI124_g18497 [Phytophthora idaei]|nr:hypothetical protein PI125_g19217 [Phytophthora idaei]KAG3130044.1 hypothetical protein PI126_g20681 [Phytophthora idaei]KAG3236496.1 hypothetical protein PI124_g18497 [Phytophthora idaei]
MADSAESLFGGLLTYDVTASIQLEEEESPPPQTKMTQLSRRLGPTMSRRAVRKWLNPNSHPALTRQVASLC